MKKYDLPGFEFLEIIGQGSFADVWKVKQTILDRHAAVKILKNTSTDDEGYDLFEKECQALAKLERAPHIVQIFDAGTVAEGQPYIVLEFVGGGTMKDFSQKGRLSETAFIELLKQAALGLQSAHSIGVLHRDVKPENLLVRESGEIVLSDFGVARLCLDERTRTGMNEPGTIRYMAPEVITGTAPSSEYSDMYSLAATFWSVASQTQPFAETSNIAQVIVKATTTMLNPLTAFGFSEELSHIFDRCLSADPPDRLSASALVDALSHPQLSMGLKGGADGTISKIPKLDFSVEPPVESEPVPVGRSRRVLAVGVLGAAITLVAGIVLYNIFGRSEEKPQSGVVVDLVSAEEVRSVSVGEGAIQPVATEKFLWVVNSEDGTVSQIELETEEVVRSIQLGENPWIPIVADGSLWVPNNGDATVSRVEVETGEVSATIQVGEFPGQSSVVDGAVIVPNEGDGTVSVIDTATNTVTKTVPVIAVPSRPVSDNESMVVVASPIEPRALVLDVESLEEITQFETGEGSLAPVIFENKIWIVNVLESTITIWDIPTNSRGSVAVEDAFLQPQFHDGRAWVPALSSLEIFDADTLQREDSVQIEQAIAGFVINKNRAWLTTASQLLEIDLENRKVLSSVSSCLTEKPPVVTGDGNVWVLCEETNQVERHSFVYG